MVAKLSEAERAGLGQALPAWAMVEGRDAIRREFDTLEGREGRERCQIGLLDRHFDDRFVWDLATHPRILDCLEAVMGPDIMLLATHFFCKYPELRDATEAQAEKFVAWHQDVTYWGLEPAFAITAWYAVDDSDTENGCMRAIPGSHATGIRDHGKSSNEHIALLCGRRPAERQGAMIVPVESDGGKTEVGSQKWNSDFLSKRSTRPT